MEEYANITSSPEVSFESVTEQENSQMDPTNASNIQKIKYYSDPTLADNLNRYCDLVHKTSHSTTEKRFIKNFESQIKKDILKSLLEQDNIKKELEELKRQQSLGDSGHEGELTKLRKENEQLKKTLLMKEEELTSKDEIITNLNSQLDKLNTKIAKQDKKKNKDGEVKATQKHKKKLKPKDRTDQNDESDSSSNYEEDYTDPSPTPDQGLKMICLTPIKDFKYVEKQADSLDMETLITIYTRLLNNRQARTTQEAAKFKAKIIEKAQKYEEQLNEANTKNVTPKVTEEKLKQLIEQMETTNTAYQKILKEKENYCKEHKVE